LGGGPDSEDHTPEWANVIFNKRREDKGWKKGWTDDNCDADSECKKKFENDKAIQWLFNGSDVPINVKTPKRDENEPFCRDVVSILVLPEKKHVMALCEIKYQKSDTPSPSNPTDPPDVNYFALYTYAIKVRFAIAKNIILCNYPSHHIKVIF